MIPLSGGKRVPFKNTSLWKRGKYGLVLACVVVVIMVYAYIFKEYDIYNFFDALDLSLGVIKWNVA